MGVPAVHKEYLDAIIAYYEDRKKQDGLPTALLSPTNAGLRDKCIEVYKSRFDRRKDIDVLVNFFGAEWKDSLEGRGLPFNIERFKPLVNYLKGGPAMPALKNIELLGWLLDFPHRPFVKSFDYEEFQKELLASARGVDGPIQTEDPGVESDEGDEQVGDKKEGSGDNIASDVVRDTNGQSDRPSNVISVPEVPTEDLPPKTAATLLFVRKHKQKAVVLAAVLIAAFFWSYYNRSYATVKSGCMVWIYDRYVPMDCDSAIGIASVVLFDESVMKNFRRITRLDTISKRHVGKLWYAKRRYDSLDLFTGGGKDPVRPDMGLHLLTEYMYKQYLRK